MANTNKVVLGSGKLYVTSAPSNGEIPEDSVIEAAGNLLGLIQGGATLTYTPTFYEAKDDLGLVSKKWLTEEVVTLVSKYLPKAIENPEDLDLAAEDIAEEDSY